MAKLSLTSEQETSLQTHAQKDNVIQNLNVLIRGAQKSSDKAQKVCDFLLKQKTDLETEIESYNMQLMQIEKR